MDPDPQHCFPLNSVADPDPGSGAFLTPGSGIRYEQPGSYFLELINHYVGLKYLNSSTRFLDPGGKKFGPGIEKRRIRDPGKHSGSATLPFKKHNRTYSTWTPAQPVGWKYRWCVWQSDPSLPSPTGRNSRLKMLITLTLKKCWAKKCRLDSLSVPRTDWAWRYCIGALYLLLKTHVKHWETDRYRYQPLQRLSDGTGTDVNSSSGGEREGRGERIRNYSPSLPVLWIRIRIYYPRGPDPASDPDPSLFS